MSQSRPLYEAFQALKDGSDWEGLTTAQKRIVDGELRDFVLGGVALEGEACSQHSAKTQNAICEWGRGSAEDACLS